MAPEIPAPGFENLLVVGSMIVPAPDDLPRRLVPLYQRSGAQDTYWVPLEEESDRPPRLAEQRLEDIRDQSSSGQVLLFEKPFPAKPSHWLILLHPGEPPLYLPATEVDRRLDQAMQEALDAAMSALRVGDRARSEDHLWYASRANTDDPLPVLLLIGLLRGTLSPERFRILDASLKRFSLEAVARARESLRDARFRPLAALAPAVPARRSLLYLPQGHPRGRGVKQMRSFWGATA